MHIPALTSSSAQQAIQLAANQIASGKRLTSAAVDPSGLAIATALTAQANGFDQGANNARDAINASTVAQGASATISGAAQRLQTLSVAANNDLLSAGDRANLQTEANQNAQEINSVAGNTQFNGIHLLDGSVPAAAVQTGTNAGSTTALSLAPSGTGALGLSNVDLSSSATAATSESSADAAIAAISTGQAKLGSQTVALQFDQQNSETASANLTASASNIADANITKTATDQANQKASAEIQIALEVQRNLAASNLLGLFPR